MRKAIDDKGAFSFPAVGAGCYTLGIVEPSNLSVTALSEGSRSLPERRFCATGQSPIGKLEVSIDSSQTVLDGKVDDSTQGLPVKVVVLEDPSTGALTVLPVNEGRFKITGLSPGAYRLYAWHDLSQAEYRNHVYLAHVANKGTEVELDSPTTVLTNLEVQPIN
jgi:hypothetical protein